MSLHVNVKSPSKTQLAVILKAIADLIAESSNKTVTINLDLTFD